MGYNDQFRYYLYRSDNTNDYVIKLSVSDAAAGGFGQPVANPLDHAAWPYNVNDLRHVTGKDANNQYRKGRLIIYDNQFALYTQGGQWTNNTTGITYNTQGAFGERRPQSHIGGG